MKPSLIATCRHAHTLGNAESENLTGGRKKRIKRTSATKNPITPLKTGEYKKKEKLIKNEYRGNRLANQKITKSEYLENKISNEINQVRFQVRSDSLLERTTESQQYQGLRGSFQSRFALFAFCDQPSPIQAPGRN